MHVYFYNFREQQGVQLPEFGRYATGILFLDKNTHKETEAAFEKIAEDCRLRVSFFFSYRLLLLLHLSIISFFLYFFINLFNLFSTFSQNILTNFSFYSSKIELKTNLVFENTCTCYARHFYVISFPVS